MKLCLNIFKMDDDHKTEELKRIIKEKMDSNKIKNIQYQKLNRRFGKDDVDFYLFFGKKSKESNLEWYENLRNIFENIENLQRKTTSIYGIVLIEMKINNLDSNNKKMYEKDKITYILTFGHGIHAIGEGIDMNFGLDMASKIARIDSINTQSSRYFSLNKNKSLIVYNNANFNTQIGEAVDYMSAKIDERIGKTAIKQLLEIIDENATFSASMKVTLEKEFNEENIYRILKNLYTIKTNYKPRLQIPKLQFLGAKYEELKVELNEKLKNSIIKNENSLISIGTYIVQKGKIQILENQDEYELSSNRNKKTYSTLTLKDVKSFMKEFKIEDITKINVKIGGAYTKKLYDFIDFTTTIKDDDNYYCLSNGKWTRFNKEYVKKIDEEIENKIKRIVEFNEKLNFKSLHELRKEYSEEITGAEYDSSKDRTLYAERVYNYWIRDFFEGKLLDRQESNTIEIADVLDTQSKALIHVKIGDPGNFIECISQSTNGARLYLNNKYEIIKKFGKELEDIKKIVLLLIINNNDVWRNKDIGKFRSLRFKLELLTWYNSILEMNYTPKIIIAKNENKR
ncbi:MAG: TIGR04141 family sporadically distributed protein [Clostridia bacterium]|nr:TIGR04141 family sporadically distributed protein [Clostridia bacterium]